MSNADSTGKGRGWYTLNGRPRLIPLPAHRLQAERERKPYYAARAVKNLWGVYRMEPEGNGYTSKLQVLCATRDEAMREVNRMSNH